MSRIKASGFGGLDLYCLVNEMWLEMSRFRASGSEGLDLYCFVNEMWWELSRFRPRGCGSIDLHCFVHDMWLEMARFKPGAREAWTRIVLFMSCDWKWADPGHEPWKHGSALFCSWGCDWKWAGPGPVDMDAGMCIVLFMKLWLEMSRSMASGSDGFDLYWFVHDLWWEMIRSRPGAWDAWIRIVCSWHVIGNDQIQGMSPGSMDL